MCLNIWTIINKKIYLNMTEVNIYDFMKSSSNNQDFWTMFDNDDVMKALANKTLSYFTNWNDKKVYNVIPWQRWICRIILVYLFWCNNEWQATHCVWCQVGVIVNKNYWWGTICFIWIIFVNILTVYFFYFFKSHRSNAIYVK